MDQEEPFAVSFEHLLPVSILPSAGHRTIVRRGQSEVDYSSKNTRQFVMLSFTLALLGVQEAGIFCSHTKSSVLIIWAVLVPFAVKHAEIVSDEIIPSDAGRLSLNSVQSKL